MHAIAHQLGAHYGIPHGRANAIVLPYILDINHKASEKRLATLARKIGLVENTKNGNNARSDAALAEYFINQVKDLIDSIGIERTVTGMQESDFSSMAKAAAKEVSDTYAVPAYMTSAQIINILGCIKKNSEALAVNSNKVA